jgi:hypothetical protein
MKREGVLINEKPNQGVWERKEGWDTLTYKISRTTFVQKVPRQSVEHL